MATLFTKQHLAAVTHIPDESDVDPELLEQTPGQPNSTQDYRDSNQDDRFGNRVTNTKGAAYVPKEATELVRWAEKGRAHVALKYAGASIVSWWDEHVTAAVDAGDLDPHDMHTSAYRYAEAKGLLPTPEPVQGKKAALLQRTAALIFVDPESPEWPAFVETLKTLPQGSKLKTEDGYTLTKNGDAFEDGDMIFMIDDFESAKDNFMPPVAVVAKDKTFVGVHREDGSWSIRETEEGKAEAEATQVTDAPNGSKAQVITAPDGDTAKAKLHEDLKSKKVTPAEKTDLARPTASARTAGLPSHVLKVGDKYVHLAPGADAYVAAMDARLVDKQSQATKFYDQNEASRWAESKPVLDLLLHDGPLHTPVKIVRLVPKP